MRFVNWYLDRLHLAAHRDAVVATAFQRVVNMLAPPSTLVSPQLAIRIRGPQSAARSVGTAQTIVEREPAGRPLTSRRA